MAYIGKQPVVGNFVKLDAIVTSATATYNLLNGGVAYFPQTANNCIVSLNGVIQSPTSAYTISGSTIVFSDALTASDSIDFILVLGDVLSIGTPSDGTVSLAKLTATGTKDATTFLRGDNTFASAGATAGQVIQVVTATDTTTRSTTSSSFATASNTLSVSITPSSASNKIFVTCTCGIAMSSTAHTGAITIFRGATDLGSGAGGMSYFKNIADDGFPTSVSVLDSPSTTSSTTYQIYVKNVSGGTTYLNSGKSSITAFEIKG